MLKINDKNIYDSSVKEMFKDYEETMKSQKINDEYKASIIVAEDALSIIDNLINAARVCPDKLTQMTLYLILSMVGGMCYSATQSYTENKINKEITTDIKELIDKLTEVLSDVLGD